MDGALAQFVLGLPFNDAGALWTSFVNSIRGFVNNNGGTAVRAFAATERPNWQEVKDVLEGRAPLSTLSSDCLD